MITFKWYGGEQIELENFNVQLALKFDNSKSIWIERMRTPHEVEVMLTSEENAYGLAGGKWFDGFVDCHSSSISRGLLYKILAVDEYRNLDFKCSKDSYYECLGKRLQSYDYSKISNKSFGGYECQFKNICSPFSLPQTNESLRT